MSCVVAALVFLCLSALLVCTFISMSVGLIMCTLGCSFAPLYPCLQVVLQNWWPLSTFNIYSSSSDSSPVVGVVLARVDGGS